MLLILLLLNTRLSAQEHHGLPVLSLSAKEVNVKGKELITLTLKIVNPGSITLKASLKINADKGLHLISRDSLYTAISAGDSLFVPVKLYASGSLVAGGDYKVSFSLYQENNKVEQQICQIKILENRQVNMVALLNSIILTGVGDSIRIPLRISNPGNTRQKIHLISRFPSRLQGDGFHNSIQLIIPAFKDTTIYINKKITRDLLQFDVFKVNVTGLYLNGDQFAQCLIDIQNLKTERYNQLPSADNTYTGLYNNSLSLSAQNFGSNFSAYMMAGGGAVDLPSGRIGYNIDATLYRNDPNRPYLRNTYLSYETHNMGISAGNITRNFDMNLNGRGVAAFIADTSKDNRYEAGYIDNSANLIGPGYYTYDSGKSGWFGFEHNGQRLSIRNSALYNKDPFMQANNLLFGNEISWAAGKKVKIGVTLSGGTTSSFEHQEQIKTGVLAGFNIDANIGDLYLNSSNLKSSDYYPGIRRGSDIFMERISYNADRLNIWAAYNYFRFAPKNFNSYINFTSEYGSVRSEIGISKTFDKFSISLSPVHIMEHGTYFLSLNDIVSGKMESWRLLSLLTYNNPLKQQSIYFNIETGKASNSLLNSSVPQFKVSGNLHYGIFNLNTSFQHGAVYISETLNNFNGQSGTYKNLSITPTMQHFFLKKRLRAEAGLSYNDVSTSGKNWLITGRTEYQLSAKTQVFASLARSQYNFNQFRYDYNNLQFGLVQKIPNARVGTKENTLEVFLYKDENQDRAYNGGDAVARGQIVYINGVAFISDKEGRVVYKNLPDGEYRISVGNQAQWYAPEQRILLNKKKVKTEVALYKTGTLKGVVNYSYNEYSYEVEKNKGGIVILATDENGFTSTVKTTDNGQFVFYLPTGSYTVKIAEGELPDEITCTNNDQRFTISQDNPQGLIFDLLLKTRKIESKKFISKSLKK